VNRNLRACVLTLLLALAMSSVIDGPAVGDDANGNAVCTAPGDQYGPVTVSDGAGGCIVAWHDLRPTVPANGVIFAQRVSATGMPQWAANGVQLTTTGDLGGPGEPRAFRHRFGRGRRRLRRLWRLELPASSAAGERGGRAPMGSRRRSLTNASSSMRDLAIVRDLNGAGGAIVVWRQDNGAGGVPDIYAQKVNAAGAIQWGSSGVAVTMTNMNSETLPALISDGAGGAIITWFNGTSGCRAQRLNAAGVSQWSGVSLSSISSMPSAST
jgi:hypothetical protein